MWKKEIPRLENGEVDYSQVDVHNDFRLFPKIFNTPADILNFIQKENVDAPILSKIIQKADNKELEWSDVERDYYLGEFFDYIYDVFRIPVDYTIQETKKWILYLEATVLWEGISGIERRAYESVFYKIISFECADRIGILDKTQPVINHHVLNIDGNQTDGINSFFIKSDSKAGQPYEFEGESYMRVIVREDSVYISGCDDMSWTLPVKNKEEAENFAEYLKRAAPIWNFQYVKLIHHGLIFTN